MRTNVTFRHPAEFVGDSEDGGGVLAVSGAQWFAALLRRVPGLQINEDLCQEDWGVVFFARRNQKKFWVGLSAWAIETRLGSLKSKSLRQFNVRQNNANRYADVVYNATFENGSGTISGRFKKDGDRWLVVNFHVNSPEFQKDHLIHSPARKGCFDFLRDELVDDDE